MHMNDPVIVVHSAYNHRYDGVDDRMTFSSRVGRCYELALTAQLNMMHHGWPTVLVHGTIGPAKNPHAWIEWRDNAGRRWAWDPILDGIMPGTKFVSEMFGIAWSRYTPAESAQQIVRDAGNGPWGKRNVERAIEAIEAMITSGHDAEAGTRRIKEIRANTISSKGA